jgi:putative membrane protein
MAALVCVGVLALPLSAQARSVHETMSGETPPPITRSDLRFLLRSTRANAQELRISRQAMTQAANPEVRALAETLVSDHERMGRELAALNFRLGTHAKPRDAEIEAERNSRSGRPGESPDRVYLEEVIAEHERALRIFEKGIQSKDPDLAAFAVQYLPTLRERLDRARVLRKSVQ